MEDRAEQRPDGESGGLYRVPVPELAEGEVLQRPGHARADTRAEHQPGAPAVAGGERSIGRAAIVQRGEGRTGGRDGPGVGGEDQRRVEGHPDGLQVRVHALARLRRQPLRRRAGERSEPGGGGRVPGGDQRHAAPGPPRQRRVADGDAHAEGRQQQHRAFVPAPQVGHLQVGGQRGAAVEPDIAQLEVVGEQVQHQRQAGAVQAAKGDAPDHRPNGRPQRAQRDQSGNRPERRIPRLRQEPQQQDGRDSGRQAGGEPGQSNPLQHRPPWTSSPLARRWRKRFFPALHIVCHHEESLLHQPVVRSARISACPTGVSFRDNRDSLKRPASETAANFSHPAKSCWQVDIYESAFILLLAFRVC
ncbi:hypothetical protein D9M71_357460 [compost metagenome]